MIAEFVKVRFPLRVDEDGFPPIGSESLNARSDGDGFVLDNTPFFVEGVALGDRVEAAPVAGDEGGVTFVRVTEASSWKAISIILLGETIGEELLSDLRGVGCYCEYGEFAGGALRMLAVAIPAHADYGVIEARFAALTDAGRISFAELAI